MLVVSLKTLRRRSGLSQLDIASRLGVHVSLIGKWETGAQAIPAYMLVRFATAYGIEPQEISFQPKAGDEDEDSDDALGGRVDLLQAVGQ